MQGNRPLQILRHKREHMKTDLRKRVYDYKDINFLILRKTIWFHWFWKIRGHMKNYQVL